MTGYVVFLVVCALAVTAWRIRRARRRRADATMIVTTWPDIELSQRYGGWDADAYDAGTGRDRTPRRSYRHLGDLGAMAALSPPPSRRGSWARPPRV